MLMITVYEYMLEIGVSSCEKSLPLDLEYTCTNKNIINSTSSSCFIAGCSLRIKTSLNGIVVVHPNNLKTGSDTIRLHRN